jgi:hypothetical protein
VVIEEYRPPAMISWRIVIGTLAVLAGMWVSGWVSTALVAGCVAAAFVGPQRALQAMMVATLVTYANILIFHPGPFTGVLQRIVLVSMALRILPMIRGSDLRILWPVWVFSLLCAITSAVTSPALPISLMKIVTFAVAATAVLIAFRRITPRALASLQTWFVSLGVTIIAVSGLMLVKPGLGIGSDGGLQGVLNQPQALGIFIAPFAAWALTGAFLMRRPSSKLEIWFAIAAVGLIIVTKARTAGFATFIGVAVVALSRLLSGRERAQASLGRPILLAGAAAIAIGALAFTTGKVGTVLTDYAFKGSKGEVNSLGGAFYESRGSGVLSEWQNFVNRPLTGNGFGVYPDGHFSSGVQYFAGIPISAPVEKGFLPTAVLEEDGIPGALSLVVMILWLGRETWRHPDLRWRALFCACLGINIGECVLLAPGGIGMIDWLLIGLALCAHRAERFPRRTTPAPAPVESAPPIPPPAAAPAGPGVPGWWAA